MRISALLGRLATLAILVAGVSPVMAQQQLSGNLDVRANVVSNCRLTMTPLDFGAYDPLGSHQTSNLETTATVALMCTPNSQVTIDVDRGINNGISGLTTRAMAAGSTQLGYEIFRDAARTQLWGTGADALHFISRRAASSLEFTVYARIPAGQEVSAGTYTDVLTATVHF